MVNSVRFWWRRLGLKILGGGLIALALFLLLVLNFRESESPRFWWNVAMGLAWCGGGILLLAQLSSHRARGR